MEEEARKARNKYMREWRSKNKNKEKKNIEEYWKRKAEKQEHATPDQE